MALKSWCINTLITTNQSTVFPCISTNESAPLWYEGVTYSSCTKTDSRRQIAWCATETEANGEVKTNKWEDCRANCPTEEDIEIGKIIQI